MKGTHKSVVHVLRRQSLFLIALGLIILALACTPTTNGTPAKTTEKPTEETTEEPPDTVVSGDDPWLVQRLAAIVKATIDETNANDLVTLNDNAQYVLIEPKKIYTDADGIAYVEGPNCESLYVFQQSGTIDTDYCNPQGSGYECSTGSILIDNCGVSFDLPNATVTILGSWMSVSHLENSQVTLIIVAEGYVTVTAYRDVEYELVDPENLVYEVTGRDPGYVEILEFTVEGPPKFLYTASDRKLEELAANVKEYGMWFPSPRAWYDLNSLPVVADVLSNNDPILNVWLGEIQQQAIDDEIEFPNLEETIPYDGSPNTLVTIDDQRNILPNLAGYWEHQQDGSWYFFLDEERYLTYADTWDVGYIYQLLEEQIPICESLVDDELCFEALDELLIVFRNTEEYKGDEFFVFLSEIYLSPEPMQ